MVGYLKNIYFQEDGEMVGKKENSIIIMWCFTWDKFNRLFK